MRGLSLLLVVALLVPVPAQAAGAPSKSRVTDDAPTDRAPPGVDEPDTSDDEAEQEPDAPKRRKRRLPTPVSDDNARPAPRVRDGTELPKQNTDAKPPPEKQRVDEGLSDDDKRRRQEAIERRRRQRRERTNERRPRSDAPPPEAPKPPPKQPAPAPTAQGCGSCCAAPCCGPSPLGCSSCGARCVTYGLVGAGAGLLVGGSAGFVLGYVAAPESANLQERAEGGVLLAVVGGVGGAVVLGLGGAMVGSAMTMALGE
ncbi:MAG: hypothetical protein ACO3JL_05765 [Myxococcota bacterium]